jgi:hypothetical protein
MESRHMLAFGLCALAVCLALGGVTEGWGWLVFLAFLVL